MKYDERQVIAQGRGYKWGFLTMAGTGIAVCAANALTGRELFGVGVAVAAILSLGCGVMAVYDILKDAFISPGGRRAPELISMGLMAAAGVAHGVRTLGESGAMPEGTLGPCWTFFALAFVCVSVFAALVVKAVMDRRGGE